MRVALISVFILVTALTATLLFRATHGDQWHQIPIPQHLQRDGNRANVVLVDRENKVLGLLATGVTWSASVSMVPAVDGWTASVSAAGHVVQLPMGTDGPVLQIAILGQPVGRFRLSPAEFDQLVEALAGAHTANPHASLDSLSVVDIVRDTYAGPDKARLRQLLSGYRTIELTEAERATLSGPATGE